MNIFESDPAHTRKNERKVQVRHKNKSSLLVQDMWNLSARYIVTSCSPFTHPSENDLLSRMVSYLIAYGSGLEFKLSDNPKQECGTSTERRLFMLQAISVKVCLSDRVEKGVESV